MWSECTLTVWLGCGHSGRRSWSWWPLSCCFSTSSGDNPLVSGDDPLVTRMYIWKARLGVYGFKAQAWSHVRLRCSGLLAARRVAAGALQQAQRSAGQSAMPVRRYGWQATCRHQQTLLRSAKKTPTALEEFVMVLHSCGQMYTIHTGASLMTLSAPPNPRSHPHHCSCC